MLSPINIARLAQKFLSKKDSVSSSTTPVSDDTGVVFYCSGKNGDTVKITVESCNINVPID